MNKTIAMRYERTAMTMEISETGLTKDYRQVQWHGMLAMKSNGYPTDLNTIHTKAEGGAITPYQLSYCRSYRNKNKRYFVFRAEVIDIGVVKKIYKE